MKTGNYIEEARHRLSHEEGVLVVVDVQDKLLPAIHERDCVLENVVRLLRFANEIEMPVLIAKQVKLGEVVEAIRQLTMDSATVEKSQFDCLACAAFTEQLAVLKKRTLLLCGIETHICVAQTALHALRDGYHVYLLADATSSRRASNVEVGVERMRSAGAVITSVEMLIYEILGEAATDLFRRVLPIIK
jgi:nicotinamidase-related amidase